MNSQGIAQVRRNFNHVFLEVPTSTLLVGSGGRASVMALASHRQPTIKTTVRQPPPQQPTSEAIDNAYSKLISNFNQSVQPLGEPLRSHMKSHSTSKLRSISKSSEKKSSAKLLPRLVNDPTTAKLSASFTVGKTRMHLQSEKKLAAKIASEAETPAQKSLINVNQLTQTKTRRQPQTERRSLPRQPTQQREASDRPKVQYIHLGQQLTEISEVRLDRKQLIEQLNGRMLSSFALQINNGRANTKSSGYQHFKQVKALQWQPIQSTIALLERFCTRYLIPYADISYQPLMQLTQIKCPSAIQMLRSLNNWHRILATRNIVGSEYLNANAQELAATRIQTYFRMVQARSHYTKVRILIEKVKVIQRFWKRSFLQRQTKRRIHQRSMQTVEMFGRLQEQLRENWTVLRTKHRVEVHIHNITLDQLSKLSMEKLQQRQNAHLSRMFRAAMDGLVDVVCVTPFEVPEELRSYYHKMLELGGMANCRDRVHFVAPELAGRLPETFSTSKLLYYSPKTMTRIKRIMAGRPGCIVSSQPTTEDVQVACQMQLPLLGGDPSKHRYYSSKCGSRSLFKRLQMPVLKGGYDIYNMEELINTIAILIYSNPKTPRWFLKIDDQREGRGLAILSINSFAAIRTFTRAIDQTSVIAAEFTETEVIKAIAEELRDALLLRLKVCDKQAYPDAKAFLDGFLLRGGVVEAGATSTENQLTTLTINFLIEPNGQQSVVSCHQKISHGHRTIGCICPCQRECEVNTQHIVRSLHRQLWHQEQMFGYFSVDVLVEHGPDQHIFFLGLDCFLNPLAGSLACMNFLTNTRFDIDNNVLKPLKQTSEELGKEKLNRSTDTINTMLSMPQPSTPGNVVCVFIPFMLHNGLEKCPLKTFFQSCRHANISFDVQQRQGVVWMLPDLLQSLAVGIMATASSYPQALKYAHQALDFLSKQYQWLKASQHSDRLEVAVVKSKLTILLKREQKSRKPHQPPPETGNISFLF